MELLHVRAAEVLVDRTNGVPDDRKTRDTLGRACVLVQLTKIIQLPPLKFSLFECDADTGDVRFSVSNWRRILRRILDNQLNRFESVPLLIVRLVLGEPLSVVLIQQMLGGFLFRLSCYLGAHCLASLACETESRLILLSRLMWNSRKYKAGS